MWRHHCGGEAALNGGGALSCGKAAAVGVIDLHCTGSHLDLFWISFESLLNLTAREMEIYARPSLLNSSLELERYPAP